MFLDRIVKNKLAEIEERKGQKPFPLLESLIPQAPIVRPFLKALKNSLVFPLIAEIKKASPSKGVLRADLDVVKTAKLYEGAGAAALSVLTDEKFFKGSLEDLSRAREAVKIPVLRKDFILDPYQIYEARLAGADAVLLIAGMIKGSLLRELFDLAYSLGMDALVEVHSKEDLREALALKPKLLGINNRNLKSFETRLQTTALLARKISPKIFIISESGIFTHDDLGVIQEQGCQGALVGESLIKADDPVAKMQELLGRKTASVKDGFIIKICGITNLKDAQIAVANGANALGFNFYERSPRYISKQKAAVITKKLPLHVRKVGVFVDAPASKVKDIAAVCRLDVLQFHGHESPEYCNRFEQEVIKVFRVQTNADLKKMKAYGSQTWLVDSFSGGAMGGTGKTFSWSLLTENKINKVILSGGMNAENVKQAILKVRPQGVDVCSGVESALGRKNYQKLKKFLNQTKEAVYGF